MDTVHTSNRAELRAVIAALQFRDWSTDCSGGWKSVMIATDSEDVVFGITERIKRWEVENWKTFDQSLRLRVDVKNQDLWKLLLFTRNCSWLATMRLVNLMKISKCTCSPKIHLPIKGWSIRPALAKISP